jgi:ferredoxin-type protein NapH
MKHLQDDDLQDAVATKGWLRAHQWLLLRRLSQLSILLLFLAGPWWGVWIIKGNLSSSLILDTVPLSDPLLILQVLFSRHWPEMAAFIGALLVLIFYLFVGGRVYCSWVCPLNIVTDAAAWLNRRWELKSIARFSRHSRYGILVLVLLLPLISGAMLWELLNPVSLLHRGVIFGMVMGWSVIIALFLFDAFISYRGWCGHLCPVGAFYALLGHASAVRVSTDGRAACNTCMECFHVCPEPQVITVPLKDLSQRPLIDAAQCSNCGRCIDVCSKDVFHFTLRRYAQPQTQLQEHTP